jgi:3-oxoacyl-[acyl-carrier protein] reductase
MDKLDRKIAFVTGASKGIGAAIAKALASVGATVVVNYATSRSDADKVVADIIAAGGKATAIQGDFSKPDDITRVYAEIAATHERLDILVNNAGVYAFGPIEQVSSEEFHREFNLNVLGLLLSTKAAVPLFGPQGGAVINIGSEVGHMAPPYGSLYSATKGALDAITTSLSKELGSRKIRVNALNPGLIETEGTTSGGFLEGEFSKQILSATPLGRLGRPEDIGRVAVFLASDDSGSRHRTGRIARSLYQPKTVILLEDGVFS